MVISSGLVLPDLLSPAVPPSSVPQADHPRALGRSFLGLRHFIQIMRCVQMRRTVLSLLPQRYSNNCGIHRLNVHTYSKIEFNLFLTLMNTLKLSKSLKAPSIFFSLIQYFISGAKGTGHFFETTYVCGQFA